MRPSVLVVDDEPRYRALYAQVLSTAGFEVSQAESAEAAWTLIERAPPAMVVSDVRMPGTSGLDLLIRVRARHPALPFLLVTAYAAVREAVTALEFGAVGYLAKPVDLSELLAQVEDAVGESANEPDDPPPEALEGIVAVSPAMRSLLRDAWQIAASDVNVLLEGESGVGKEVLARLLHRGSARRSGPFVAVNCAALPAEILAAELFGHERGAFTGASSARPGKFRESAGGVLFLDEIGDMPLSMQPVLLRAIETRSVAPLGATGERPVNFRLIAATNAGLADQVAAGRFRTDLYYRLNVITLEIPPLRMRPEDILPLARSFLAEGDAKRISRAAAQQLLAHHWPGNVRELRNAMLRAQLLSRADVVLPEHLPASLGRGARDGAASVPGSVRSLRDGELDSLKQALRATNGNRTLAAALLGITRRGLYKKMKRFGLT